MADQHYYLWCGADDWGESINRYTDTIIGNQDDRILEEDTWRTFGGTRQQRSDRKN